MPVMVGVGKGEVRGGKVGRVHSSVVLVRRVQGPARPFPPSGSNDPCCNLGGMEQKGVIEYVQSV